MIITCLFFGHYRDFAPESLPLEVPEGATIADAASSLTKREPRFGDLLKRTRVAVGGEFAAADSVLQEGDEVAFLPPMSGG